MVDHRRLESLEELDPLLEASREQRVLLFKHSLTCPISLAAFRRYEEYLESADDGVEHVLVEVQRAREVSNAIAEETGVRHESPQALLIDKGEVAWHASHWKITGDTLRQAIG